MSQPFVVSMKIVGDSSDAVQATDDARQSLNLLNSTVVQASIPTTKAHSAAIAAEATALRINTAAVETNLMVNRAASAQRANLIFQLNDIGVSLASGMNPLMVAIQQGSQIATIYGGQGGIATALKETGNLALGMATKFAPLLGALALGATGVAAMQHQIEEATGKGVTFGDVLLGAFQVVADGVMSILRPAIEPIGQWLADAWDWGSKAIVDGINFTARGVASFAETVRYIVSGIPAFFTRASEDAANFFVGNIETMVNETLRAVRDLATGLNLPFWQDLGTVELGRVSLGGADALQTQLQQLAEHKRNLAGISQMNFVDMVGDRAVQNMNDRLADTKKEADEATKSVKGLAQGLSDASDSAETFSSTILNSARSAMGSFFNEVRRGLTEGRTGWDMWGSAAANALDQVAEAATASAGEGEWGNPFGAGT